MQTCPPIYLVLGKVSDQSTGGADGDKIWPRVWCSHVRGRIFLPMGTKPLPRVIYCPRLLCLVTVWWTVTFDTLRFCLWAQHVRNHPDWWFKFLGRMRPAWFIRRLQKLFKHIYASFTNHTDQQIFVFFFEKLLGGPNGFAQRFVWWIRVVHHWWFNLEFACNIHEKLTALVLHTNLREKATVLPIKIARGSLYL